jgi:DNA polymerase-3 subunit gamma/tau
VRFQPPELVIRPQRPLGGDFTRDLAASLKAITGATWEVATTDGPAEPSLLEQEKAQENAARDAILATPIVRAAFESFPEAELIGYSAPEKRSLAS